MINKNRNKNSSMDLKAKIGTVIGPGAVFDGNFETPESVRVDGTINGNCTCKELLIVGVEGKINGDIHSQNVIISGKVEGDIMASGKLELLSTGKLVGNITARSLVVDEDACFDGRCTMTTSTSLDTGVSIPDKNKDKDKDKEKSRQNDFSMDLDNKKKY
ncbi:MAG: polymer-forming cytoskeletal protein [Lachnospiraceae bacterium]|jgi:cytoskeletal protein CcmA (bactofilin family)|nr:polymer-forming cytoskeletal protein [Lachnospiraceae bacterium]